MFDQFDFSLKMLNNTERYTQTHRTSDHDEFCGIMVRETNINFWFWNKCALIGFRFDKLKINNLVACPPLYLACYPNINKSIIQNPTELWFKMKGKCFDASYRSGTANFDNATQLFIHLQSLFIRWVRSFSMCARACVCFTVFAEVFSLKNGNILSVRAYLLSTQSWTNCFDCLIALNHFGFHQE